MSLSIKPNSLGDGATIEYNGTTCLSVNSTGWVSTGALSATGPVTIAQGSAAFALNQINAYTNGYLYLNGNTNGLFINGTSSGADRMRVGLDVASGTNIISFDTNSTERARITSSGELLINQTTSDGVNKLQVNGGITTQGIKFPSTQVASVDVNTLDDYEEGTWTPTATVGGVPVTCIGNRCSYTVVGNRVFVEGIVSVTVGSAAGALKIYGFPFTLSTGAYPVASHWGIGEVAGYRSNIVFNAAYDMYIAGASGMLILSTGSGVPSTECIFIYNFHYIK